MKHLINIIFGIITTVCIICFALSYSASFIPPDSWILPTYFGMAYPIFWCGTVILAIIWILRHKYIVSLLLAGLLVLTFPNWRNSMVINKITDVAADTETFSILTYNVMLFDFQKQIDNILDFIAESDADIVALQEFGYYFNNKNKEKLFSGIEALYPYRQITYKAKNKRYCIGTAILSRYPIINSRKINYESDYNLSTYSDIVIDDDTIRLINNHLESNKLNANDKKLAQLLREDPTSDDVVKTGNDVRLKLGAAAQKRTAQAQAVRHEINRSPYPVIVVGDFNDTPQSYTYHLLAQNLNDVYSLAGPWGYRWSYNRDGLYFRIDHILADRAFTPVKAEIGKVKYSDHYPLKAEIGFK